MSSKMLSKENLQSFITDTHLDSVVDFLDFLQEKENLQKFFAFCAEKNILQESMQGEFANVVFHGSQSPDDTLKPSASIGIYGKAEDESLVYATDDANYAIFLAVIQLNNASAGATVTEETTDLVIDIDFVNGPSKFVTGFVHVLPVKTFKAIGNREYVSKEAIESLFIIPVQVSDLTVPINIG